MSQPTQYGQFRPEGDENTCYRHPRATARIRCQRCERYICPQCYNPAAVGVLCPECAGPAATSSQKVRVKWRLGSGKPIVTYWIIGICVFFYLVDLIFPRLSLWLGFIPAFSLIQPWRFVTTAFMHGGLAHIFMNMFVLLQLGYILEPLLGKFRFLSLYLLSALGGSVAVLVIGVFFEPHLLYANTVGASGAVFGLFAALFVIERHVGSSAIGIGIILAINFVWGLFTPNISWEGHLGGLLTGAMVTFGLVQARKLHQKRRQRAFASGGTQRLNKLGDGLFMDVLVVVLSLAILLGITTAVVMTVIR